MSGNVNDGGAWPESVSDATTIQFIDKVEEVGSNAYCTAYSYANLTEQNYIGLSSTSFLPQAAATQNTQALFATPYAKVEELENGDTELRLGIGPQCNGDAISESHGASATQSVSHQQMTSASRQSINKQGDTGSDAPYQHRGDVLLNTAMEVDRSFWPWIVSGRFRIPVPKVSIAPAKRPYMEVGGESGDDDKAFACALSTNSRTPSEAASQPQSPLIVSSLQGGLYSWSHNSGSPSDWQHACPSLDVGASYADTNTLATRSLPSPPVFKVPPTPPISQYSPQRPSTTASPVAPYSSIPSSEGRASLTRRDGEEDARMSKAPVVGWPPVRSFRKNTMQLTVAPGVNKAGNASSNEQKPKDANTNTPEGVSNKESPFVKVKLDGIRICRKVDLTSYDNYDSLKSALQKMFQGFVCNDNAKIDLLQGKNYVLTHEDKDGDWMLVGDVPWHMFVTTVKSFRIMKAVDAVRLGEKMLAKLRPQDIA